MAIKPKRPCVHPGCAAFAIEGASRCVRHHRVRVDARPSSAARGYGAEWQERRKEVIDEHPICQRCGVKPARDVHHLRALRQGGTHERGNLIALCRSCHLSVERQAVTR